MRFGDAWWSVPHGRRGPSTAAEKAQRLQQLLSHVSLEAEWTSGPGGEAKWTDARLLFDKDLNLFGGNLKDIDVSFRARGVATANGKVKCCLTSDFGNLSAGYQWEADVNLKFTVDQPHTITFYAPLNFIPVAGQLAKAKHARNVYIAARGARGAAVVAERYLNLVDLVEMYEEASPKIACAASLLRLNKADVYVLRQRIFKNEIEILLGLD